MTKEMKYPLPAYNTRREQLIMPEYGRTIQDMVDVALQIEDREERNRRWTSCRRSRLWPIRLLSRIR